MESTPAPQRHYFAVRFFRSRRLFTLKESPTSSMRSSTCPMSSSTLARQVLERHRLLADPWSGPPIRRGSRRRPDSPSKWSRDEGVLVEPVEFLTHVLQEPMKVCKVAERLFLIRLPVPLVTRLPRAVQSRSPVRFELWSSSS